MTTVAKVLLALQPGDVGYTPENPYKWADAEGILTDPEVVAGLSATYAQQWKPTTAYVAGQPVVNPTGDVVTAKTGFTSGATYNPVNWNLSASYAQTTKRGLEQLNAQQPFAALRQFHSDLALRNTAPVDIVWIGDSISEGIRSDKIGERAVWKFRDTLRTICPTSAVGGLGYIPAKFHASYLTDNPVTLTGTSGSDFGFGYRSQTLSSAADTVTLTATCTAVDIHYTAYNGAGSFVYQVDGGAWSANVPTSGTLSSNRIFKITGLTAGQHTIVVKWSVAPAVFIDGFFVYNGDEAKGVRMWEGAMSGATTANFLPNDVTKHWPGVVQANPSLAIIALGTNDVGTAPHITPAQYKTNLNTIINAFNTYNTRQPSILLVSPYFRGDITPTSIAPDTIADYINKQWEIASERTNVAVWDSGTRLLGASGATASTASQFINGDLVHPTNAGQIQYGESLARWIAPS